MCRSVWQKNAFNHGHSFWNEIETSYWHAYSTNELLLNDTRVCDPNYDLSSKNSSSGLCCLQWHHHFKKHILLHIFATSTVHCITICFAESVDIDLDFVPKLPIPTSFKVWWVQMYNVNTKLSLCLHGWCKISIPVHLVTYLLPGHKFWIITHLAIAILLWILLRSVTLDLRSQLEFLLTLHVFKICTFTQLHFHWIEQGNV